MLFFIQTQPKYYFVKNSFELLCVHGFCPAGRAILITARPEILKYIYNQQLVSYDFQKKKESKFITFTCQTYKTLKTVKKLIWRNT